MIRLTSTEKLQAVLAGAISTTQPQAVACFSDQTTTAYSGGKQLTALNSTTDVDIVAAPAASAVRDVDYLSIYNRDTASVTVTVKYDVSGVDSVIITVTLLTLETLEYTHSGGWKVLTSVGAVKVPVSAVSPAGASGDVQYNNGASFGAEAAFNYNSGTNTLSVDNITIATAGTVPTPAESDNDTSIASTAFVNANISGTYGCRGNRSLNNTGTPNSQVDLVADVVILRNTNNHVVIRHAPSTVTNDVTTAGSTANGRDQAGAFSASSWIHFYWIWNGTTLASLSSAVAPPTGPTLPSGYTHWAYSHAHRFDGSSNLLRVKVRGCKVTYGDLVARPVALNAGAATSETAVDISAIIPPNALMYHMAAIAENMTSDGAGTIQITYGIRTGTGVNNINVTQQLTGLGLTAGQNLGVLGTLEAPNIGQQFFYIITNTAGSGTLTLVIENFSIPNGDS